MWPCVCVRLYSTVLLSFSSRVPRIYLNHLYSRSAPVHSFASIQISLKTSLNTHTSGSIVASVHSCCVCIHAMCVCVCTCVLCLALRARPRGPPFCCVSHPDSTKSIEFKQGSTSVSAVQERSFTHLCVWKAQHHTQ